MEDDPTVSITNDARAAARSRSGEPRGSAAEWGPFKLLDRVGEGSFGEVYRAFDTTLEREVALKLLLPRGADQDAEVRAVLREARALARVRHPNVVSVYGVDTHDGRVGFWSDFVRGRTLSAILEADGPFGPRETALIGIDLCRAVSAVHHAGLLHRDIKAGNVMREAGGRILLMDFGLTHAQEDAQQFSGTPIYMAPELFSGGAASVASDIYALGILLFHLLTAKYPIDSNDFRDIISAHKAGERRRLLDIRPDLPERLVQVIETATSAEPAARYQSAGQMISALTEAVGVNPATGEVPATPVSRRYGWWIAAAFVLFLVVLLSIPQIRNPLSGNRTTENSPVAGVQDDYEKAHDLINHYYRPKALETAIPMLQKVVEQDPRFAPAFADLCRANVLQFIQWNDAKYIEPARQAGLQALSINPDLVSAHVALGMLYTWTDKQDLASQELDTALRLDKNNAAAYGAKAELLYRQGRNNEVESTLQNAISFAPDEWGLLAQLGLFYLDIGKLNEAAEQYQRAITLAPDNPRAYNNLGLVLQAQGKLAEAEAAFRKSIELEPTYKRYRNLATVFMDEGKFNEAQGMLEKAITLRPDYYDLWGNLGTVLRNAGGDRAKTDDAFKKAIDLGTTLRKQTPNDPFLLAYLGTYYAAIGNEHEALPLLKQANALASDKPDVLYQVVIGYERLNRRDLAIATLKKTLAGGIAPRLLQQLPELSHLREDSRYTAMIKK